MSKNKKTIKRAIILFTLIICYLLYILIDIYSYGNVNEIVKADAAIVLGAAVWNDIPSPVFKARIDHGIWLYKNGYVNKIIFTGGKGKNSSVSESGIAKIYAMENSIPEEDIFIEEKSTVTQENIEYAAQIVNDNNIASVIIVSDPLHMKRAMLMCRDYGLQVYSSPTPDTRYITFKSKTIFLAREIFYYIGYQIYRLF